MKMNIEIDNITEPQRIALEDMFATMVNLGNIGASRWVCFYSDGDGNYRPNILINGTPSKFTNLISKEERKNNIWIDKEYRIDFDLIACKLRKVETNRWNVA